MFEKEILNVLARVGIKDVELEIPPDSSMGDYSLPCFKLAKNLKKHPAEIAQELSGKIKPDALISKIEPNGPYLNIFVNKGRFIEKVLGGVLRQRNKYGFINIGKNRRVVIEHTSINPNAAPHVGRARNALIGDSLTRIFRFVGFKPEVHYWVNDVGKQVAMLVYAGGNKKLSFEGMLRQYIAINKRLKKNPRLEKNIFQLLNALERGDRAVKKRFESVVRACLTGQIGMLKELDIHFDKYDFESGYLWNRKLQDIIRRLEKKETLSKDEEGRLVLNQEELKLAMKSPYFVLTRSDGTSLYGLRDIAYTIDKLNLAKENVIVLGEDQKLYFKQISSALQLLGYKPPRVVHYSFVLLSEGKKMSTRTGDVVLLQDFMKQAIGKAEREIKKRYNKTIKSLAKKIGYGALKYTILKISPEKNVLFDWKQCLAFDGETGPYLQYTHARACSILSKYNKPLSRINYSLLVKEEEFNLAKQIALFPSVIEESYKNLRPHLIAVYLYQLAKTFNEFYHTCQCLSVDKELTKARLALVYATRTVVKNGLNMLGIEAPERM